MSAKPGRPHPDAADNVSQFKPALCQGVLAPDRECCGFNFLVMVPA
ncbi:MAG: hypothetical protein M0Q92_08465 [Methanoregula sp.]|nr:hypothetical protein [Methanoregula sp.]